MVTLKESCVRLFKHLYNFTNEESTCKEEAQFFCIIPKFDSLEHKRMTGKYGQLGEAHFKLFYFILGGYKDFFY